MTSNELRVYGLVGFPVKHSLSPLMHNAAFSFLNINAEYKLFDVKPEDLLDFIRSVSKRNIFGLNVTIPHKEKVIPLLDSVSSEASLIGAVNTIKVSGDKLEGFNTDGAGFLKHLKEDLYFYPEGKAIAILGAGGASRAVSVILSQEKPKKISIFDVELAKSQALADYINRSFNVDCNSVNSIEALNLGNTDLLINATPIGMKESDPCLIKKEQLHPGVSVYDLIYNPKETKLLKIAKEVGSPTANGLGMLLYQGMIAFEIWTGNTAPLKIMKDALLEGVRKL